MQPIYRIVDWRENFENNRTRELQKMSWIPIPTKLDGDGYTELVDHPEGGAIYGAWVACVLIAGRCEPRGTLLRQGARPHTPESLSRISRISESLFHKMFERAVHVGWLEVSYDGGRTYKMSQEGAIESQEGAIESQEGAIESQEGATIHNSTEQNRREDNKTIARSRNVNRADDISWTPSDGFSGIEEDDLTALGEAYPACDVQRQLRSMHQWLLANPVKSKKRCWRRFITGWLARQQERGGDAKSNRPEQNAELWG